MVDEYGNVIKRYDDMTDDEFLNSETIDGEFGRISVDDLSDEEFINGETDEEGEKKTSINDLVGNGVIPL